MGSILLFFTFRGEKNIFKNIVHFWIDSCNDKYKGDVLKQDMWYDSPVYTTESKVFLYISEPEVLAQNSNLSLRCHSKNILCHFTAKCWIAGC